MGKFTTAVLVAGLLAGLAWSEPNLNSDAGALQFVHPNAKVLIGIEWRKTLESDFGDMITRQMDQAGVSDAGLKKGAEILRQIDRVLISSPGKSGARSEQPPALIVLKGRFHQAELKELAKAEGAVPEKYGSLELLAPPDAKPASARIAFVDERTILVGDPDSIQGAIDRSESQAGVFTDNPVFARAADVSPGREIWMVASISPMEFANAGAPGYALAADVEGIEAGVSFRNGMDLEMILNTRTAESAKTLASAMQALLSVMPLSGKEHEQTADILKQLEIVPDNATVKISLLVGRDQLSKSFGEMRGSFQKATQSGFDAKPGSGLPIPSTQSRSERKKMIRIYGLDQGVLEIPYSER